jgi:phosphatidylglycerophosphatase A
MTRVEDKKASLPYRVAYGLATGAGAGFAPIAPGTFGALEGVAIFLAVIAFPLAPPERTAIIAGLAVVSFVVGVWASKRACEICGLKDPGQVVIDEISGQLIALTPLAFEPSIAGIAVSFLLFRIFDIFKPYPIYKLERLPSGLGVMADDALAGIYAAALVWLGLQAHLL